MNRCRRLTSLTACASCASAGIANSNRPEKSLRRFQCVREIDPRPLVAFEAVAGLVELEPDLQVRDSIRRHQQLVAVQPRQQVLRDVLVPEVMICLSPWPCALHLATSVLWMRSMASTRKVPVPVAGSRIWTKAWLGWTPSGIARSLWRRHLAPGGRIGEAVLEAELGAQQLVHRTHDVGDYRARGVEDAAPLSLLSSYSLRKSS